VVISTLPVSRAGVSAGAAEAEGIGSEGWALEAGAQVRVPVTATARAAADRTKRACTRGRTP
jgi:hypothetical protein